MNYGYQESQDLGPGKQGGSFGLNTGANITKFEYNPNSGQDGSLQDAIDLTVQVGEREYRLRFFPIAKAWAKGGGEITDTKLPEYQVSIDEQVSQLNATLSDIVKCFVDSETLKQALSVQINSFKNYAQILERLVQGTPNWNKQLVDVFLQYQWVPSEGKDKTYLELPKNVKQGIFICKSLGGDFKEERTDTNLRYVNAKGEYHIFKRGKWFLESAYANPVDLSSTASSAISTSSNTPTW